MDATQNLLLWLDTIGIAILLLVGTLGFRRGV
jgi:hypothetical protein